MVAKTKVVPIKPLTMPHLELHGVVITARLLNHVARYSTLSQTIHLSGLIALLNLDGFRAIQGALKHLWGIE